MKKNIALLLITGFLIFIVSELTVRIIDWRSGHSFWSNAHRNFLVRETKPVLPYRVYGWNLYRVIDGQRYIASVHDELYPFKKPENTFRIVAFGGSTTKNFVDGVHYPLLLERRLQERYPKKHIEVINVGNSAYTTVHSLTLLMFDVLSWDPDAIIVSHNINDLLNAYFPNLTPDYSNQYGLKFYLPQYKNRLTLSNALFNWSSFYWFMRARAGDLLSDVGYKNAGPYRRASYGNEPPELIQHVFKRNLETFAIVARANAIPVIFGTQPFEPSEEYFDRALRVRPFNKLVTYPLHEELIAHHRRFNEIIKEVAREKNTYLVDNAASFNGDRSYFVDFVHYNRKGLEKLAENYATFIIAGNMIK